MRSRPDRDRPRPGTDPPAAAPIRIADVRPRGRVEERGAVAHASRHRVADRGAAPAFARVRAHRVAGARRFEAEQPAGGGGNADGASAIGRVRHRQDPGGHRRRRAAARSAGAVVEIPRIAGGAEPARLGGRRQPHLGRVGLADDDEPGALEAEGELAVVVEHVVGEQRAAVRGDHALIVGAEILQEIRHAGERPVCKPGAQRGPGLIVHARDDRVDRGVARLDRASVSSTISSALTARRRTSSASPSPCTDRSPQIRSCRRPPRGRR